MKKPMSRLLASVLAAIMLINCMIVTALAADARVISMNYQPHPLYPGMNGNAVVEVDYGDSTACQGRPCRRFHALPIGSRYHYDPLRLYGIPDLRYLPYMVHPSCCGQSSGAGQWLP